VGSHIVSFLTAIESAWPTSLCFRLELGQLRWCPVGPSHPNGRSAIKDRKRRSNSSRKSGEVSLNHV
jgi:hypothetical protein